MSCLPNFRSFDRLSQNFPVNILQKLRSKRTYYPLGRVRRLPEEHRYERFHMNRSTSQMRDFARRLMALEAAVNKNSDSKTPATFHVCEKLRPSLATMMGNAGFQALLSYALALAIKEVACLRAVHVNVDGSLEGLVELKEQVDPERIIEGKIVLIAQLLGLMVVFIGEGLTVRLVCEVWPKVSLNNLGFAKGNKNEKTK